MQSSAVKIDGKKSFNMFYETFIYLIDVKRSLAIKTPSYAGSKSDQLLLAQIFIDIIGARLDPEVENLMFFFFVFN